MTDKEQIIIDGVDVSGCKNFSCGNCEEENKIPKTINHFTADCRMYPNCYFKQLARKTQECEELKKQLETSEEWRIKAESLNENFELKNTSYHKALEKIEGLVKNFCKDCDDYEDCNWEKEGCYYSLIPNLKDIINKAKGDNDENT